MTALTIRLGLLPILAALFAGMARAETPASTTAAAIPNADTRDPTLLNLGPLGVRVKTELDRQGQGVGQTGEVAYVFKNSRAEGKLELGDVITSVDGTTITAGIGKAVGAAIDRAEGTDGTLTLGFTRGGQQKEAVFRLPVIGSFTATFPYNDPKSDRVLAGACDWLAAHQRPSGRWEADGDGYVTVSSYAALALLASGDPKYEPNLRAAADALLKTSLDPATDTLIGWKYNHLAWFLSEYYLQTRDPAIPPKLREIDRALRNIQLTQMEFPYWFAHGEFKKKALGPDDGYVYLGVQVANSLVSWSLMRECGVDVDEPRLAATWAAVEVAGPTGEMPYAARPGQPGGDGDAFGRTGVSAVVMHLWGKDPAFAKAIAASLAEQLPTNFFNSHGTSVMGKTWGALGCAAADPALYRKLMDEYKASLDLMRLADGRFVPQPAGTHTTDFAGGFTGGHVWTTACNALIFAPAKSRLRIAGGDFAILGVDPAALTGDLLAAYNEITAGRDHQALDLLDRAAAAPEDARVAKLLRTFAWRADHQ